MDLQNLSHEKISPTNAVKDVADREFTPSVDMMVHDYDDERTLAEEEALGPLEDPQAELTNLQKEGDMPIEDLMAMYGYSDTNGDEKNEVETVVVKEKKETSELEQLYEDETNKPTSSKLPQSEDEADGDSSSDEEVKKKTIMVGSDYQAYIPEKLCKYDTKPYQNEDKLIWDPSSMHPSKVDEFLNDIKPSISDNGKDINHIPNGIHSRDNEQALYLLLKCGNNFEEAIKELKSTPVERNVTTWTEEECQSFETGLRALGKDFRKIQQTRIKTKTVAELVQFYYLWKKTERHDIFANKTRLDKKKYSLHPGITDYMDRFLEDQETNKDAVLSVNVHSLLASDSKHVKIEPSENLQFFSEGKTKSLKEDKKTDIKKEDASLDVKVEVKEIMN